MTHDDQKEKDSRPFITKLQDWLGKYCEIQTTLYDTTRTGRSKYYRGEGLIIKVTNHPSEPAWCDVHFHEGWSMTVSPGITIGPGDPRNTQHAEELFASIYSRGYYKDLDPLPAPLEEIIRRHSKR